MESFCNLCFYQKKNISTVFKEIVVSLGCLEMWNNNPLYVQTCPDMAHYHHKHSTQKFNFRFKYEIWLERYSNVSYMVPKEENILKLYLKTFQTHLALGNKWWWHLYTNYSKSLCKTACIYILLSLKFSSPCPSSLAHFVLLFFFCLRSIKTLTTLSGRNGLTFLLP